MTLFGIAGFTADIGIVDVAKWEQCWGGSTTELCVVASQQKKIEGVLKVIRDTTTGLSGHSRASVGSGQAITQNVSRDSRRESVKESAW